jgi:membrane-associated phospholipid phosphatase
VSLGEFDRCALLLARTRWHAPGTERAISLFSRTGEHAACWLALGAVGAVTASDARRRRTWVRGGLIVAGSYAANFAVKLAVRRSRPQLPGLEPLTPTVSRLSFPSAHATTSFAAARAFSEVAPAALLYAAAVAYAVSRPYLGVHYPSDVVAGALLGTAIAEGWPKVQQ